MYPLISELWGFSQCQAGLRCRSSIAKSPVFPFHSGLNSRSKCVYIGFKVSWLSSVYLACVQRSPQFLSGPQVYCTAACLQSYPQCRETGKLTACGVQSTGSEKVGILHVRKESGHAVRMWLPEQPNLAHGNFHQNTKRPSTLSELKHREPLIWILAISQVHL